MAWWPWKLFHGAQPLAESVRGSAIQAAVAWVGGVIALGTFFLNRSQKQEHFDRQTIEARFVDIQDRFADKDSPMMRASAAIRLAEMAQAPAPGFKVKRLDPSNYPNFPRAGAQLSAALHMEPDQAVRDEVKNALERMVEFSKKDLKGGQRLLYLLIEELRRSNQSAIRAVRYALAMCLRKEIAPIEAALTKQELEDLGEIARFCSHAAANHAAWRALAFRIERRGERSAESSKDAADDLRERAARLCDTRDALAAALRALAEPWDFLAGADPELHRKWRRMDRFELYSAFLAGADIREAQLQGANLIGARLQGAIIREAQLQGADIRAVWLQGADLSEAQLQGADIRWADLQGAKLHGTKLARILLVSGDPANPDPPDLTDTNWRDADFNFKDGSLDDETYIWVIEHYGTDDEKREWAARGKTGENAAWEPEAASAVVPKPDGVVKEESPGDPAS